MRLFHPGRRQSSGGIAKERLSTLQAAERLNCSPRAMQMLKNDLTHAAEKYLTIETSEISVTITQSPAVLTARIPLKKNEESHVKTL